MLIASLRSFIAEVNDTLDKKAMDEQRETYISTISFLYVVSNMIKYGVASGNVVYKMMGWLVSLLGAVFSNLKDLLPMLWPDKE